MKRYSFVWAEEFPIPKLLHRPMSRKGTAWGQEPNLISQSWFKVPPSRQPRDCCDEDLGDRLLEAPEGLAEERRLAFRGGGDFYSRASLAREVTAGGGLDLRGDLLGELAAPLLRGCSCGCGVVRGHARVALAGCGHLFVCLELF